HDHEVRHRGVPRRGAVALAEQGGDPRRLAQALVLRRVLGDDRAAGRPHAVGHARARGLAEEDERHAEAAGRRLHVADLLHVDDAARGAEHGEVVRDQRHLAPVDLREAGDLAVRRRAPAHFGPYAAGVAPRLDEGAGIDEIVDALARVEHALRLALRELLPPTHGERLRFLLLELFQQPILAGEGCHRLIHPVLPLPTRARAEARELPALARAHEAGRVLDRTAGVRLGHVARPVPPADAHPRAPGPNTIVGI